MCVEYTDHLCGVSNLLTGSGFLGWKLVLLLISVVSEYVR